MGCHLTCPEFSQEPQRRAPGGVEGSGRRQPRRGELTPGRAPPRSHRPSRPEPSTPRRSDRHAARTCSRSPGRAEKEHAEEEEEEQRPPRHGPAGSAPPPGPPASLPKSRDDCRCPRSETGGGRARGPPHTFNAAAAAEGKSDAIGGRLEGGGGCRPAPLLLLH